MDTIVILDLGSAENEKIVREIGNLGVNVEFRSHDITIEELNAIPNVKGVILNGGPNRIVNGVERDVVKEIYNAPVPVLMVDHQGDVPWPADDAEREMIMKTFVFALCGAAEP